jgi:hypothetical protein
VSTAPAQAQDSKKPQQKQALVSTGSIELTINRGIALAHVVVDGKTRLFMVDSGSEATIINSDRIDLPTKRVLRSELSTMSGSGLPVVWKVVNLHSLKLGQLEIRDREALSRSLAAVEKELTTEVDGILGADLLRAWDSVQLDYRGKVLTLGSCSPCGSDTDRGGAAHPAETFVK